MDTGVVWAFVSTQGMDFALKVLAALAAWFVGRWMIGLLKRGAQAALHRGKRVDQTLAVYLASILSVGLNILLFLAILDIFGVKTTSFAALLAGAGLAIGTAWGGLLTHFAAGVFLQVLRPYKVGDHVKKHDLWGGGAYVYTNVDPTIHATRGFEVPVRPGVKLRSLLTVNLGAGTIDHVVNNTGDPVSNANTGTPSYVVSFK